VAPAVDVGQNVVPQGRVLGVGPLLQPGAREPLGSRRYPSEMQLDRRIEKTFTVSGNRFGIHGDIQNVFNRGGITSVLTRVPGTDTSTPQGIVTLPFETPGTIQDPRQLRLGGRWSF